MSNKLKDDVQKYTSSVDGFSEIRKEIIETDQRINVYKDSLKDLEREKKKLLETGKKLTTTYRDTSKEIRKVKEDIAAEKNARKELISQLSLNELSYFQLQERAKKLTQELKYWSVIDGQEKFDQTRAELTAVEEQIGKTKQALGLVSKDMQKSPSIWSKAWSSIKGLIPVASLGAAFAFIKKGISEVIETSKKLQGDHVRNMASLGDEYGYVAMQAEKLHRRMGITKNDFVTAAAATSDFMKNIGFVPAKAAKMSTEIEYLSGVMNKWSGGKYSTAEASQIFQNALLGETNRLRELGVVVNKNSDEFKSRLKVLMDDQKVTKDQAQAMLVLEMAYEQTKDAQADFAAGGNNVLTMGNQLKSGMRGLKEELVELIALSKSERLEKKRKEVYAMNEEYANQKRAIEPLIVAYEELYGNVGDNAEKQERLNNVLAQLSRIAPGVVTQYDEFGAALNLNIETLEKFIGVQDEMNKKRREKVNNQGIAQLEKDLKIIRSSTSEIRHLDSEIRKLQNLLDGTTGTTQRKVIEADINYMWESREILLAGSQKTIKESQERIDILVKEGYTYEEIGKSIGRNVRQVEELHQEYLKIEEVNKRKAAEAAALAALQLTDDEIKARAAALLAAKSAAEQEKVAFAERLKQNRLTEEGITAIRAKSANERTERELEDLAVYEALYQVHQDNLTEIDRKANASRIAEEEKAARERERLMQARDTIIGGGGTQTEQENYNYAKRLADAGIYEDELKRISEKAAEDRTEAEQKYYLAAEILRKQHEANLDKIETEAINKWKSEQDQKFASELTQLKTKQNEEYVAVATYEDALELLRTRYADRDLSDIKTIGDARKAIREEQQRAEREMTEAHYDQIIQYLDALVGSGALDDLTIGDGILSDEQKEDILRRIEEIKLKMSELGVGAVKEDSEKSEKKADFGSASLGNDIFGMSQDDWATLFENLEKSNLALEEKTLIATTLASTLTNVFAKYGEYVSAQEAKQLQQYESNSKRRKRELENELAQGLISRKDYNSQIEQLEQELDDKRADIEIKQAKREKALAIVQAIINTAAAVAKASPNIALMALAALSGAAQVAIIAAQPIPGKEKGGRIKVKREQDGRNFNAEFSPQKRGFVHGPTVIVGENGTEYVLSAADLKNPSVANFVESLERAKLQGSLRDFRIPYETGRGVPGRSAGGFVGSNSTAESFAAVAAPPSAYGSEMESAIKESTEVSRKLLKRLEQPLYARLVWSGKDGLKAFMDKDTSITQNVKI